MLTDQKIIEKYISFFEKRGHKRIINSPLVPENDPTTLFTSSGMQPLVPYLLGEPHPQGTRLVNVQNCFRAQDIDEVGDNRHTTFFRMLGNWSLGDYFKKEQLVWFFEFLTKELGLDPKKLYVTVFEGFNGITKDTESIELWKEIFSTVGVNAKEGEPFDVAQGKRIFAYGVEKNWWSRVGVPENMTEGEPGGPDSEVFYDLGETFTIHEQSKYKHNRCHVNCDCGRFIEIGNSVFMQYQRHIDGSFKELPQKNVDFGGGLERLLVAIEERKDIFETSLFSSIVQTIELLTGKTYEENSSSIRIVVDHLIASSCMTASHIVPSNKEQGYMLRRLIRRALDNLYRLGGKDVAPILESIVEQYKETDPYLVDKFEHITYVILEEEQRYSRTRNEAKKFIQKRYHLGDELKGLTEISADDAFLLYSTHGLSPTQIKSLGYAFDEKAFSEKMKAHQTISRKGAEKKFAGGLADHSRETIMGHTATHLLHQAIRDVLGDSVHQTGSNITSARLRFDFNFGRKLTSEELQSIEDMVNEKIKENLTVHFEILSKDEASTVGAIGLFDEKYQDKVKVYFIGPHKQAYSVELCGGPHVDFTGELKRFKIVKEEGLGKETRRVYAVVGDRAL